MSLLTTIHDLLPAAARGQQDVRRAVSVVMVAGLCLSSPALGQPVAPASTETAEPVEVVDSIQQAIERLASDEFLVRQRATDYLWSLGEAAVPALEQAARSRDREVELRARSIIERLRYGMFADTPDEEVVWINRFRYGGQDDQRQAFLAIVHRSRLATLLALLKTVEDPELRSDLQQSLLDRLERDKDVDRLLELAERWMDEASQPHREALARMLRRQVPSLLAAGRRARAEGILRGRMDTDAGIRDWAAYLLLENRLDEGIAEFSSAGAARPLAYCWRAQGNLAEARRAAARVAARFPGLYRGVLFEQRDWAALAALHQQSIREDPVGLGRNIEAIGYGAAFCRLAGEEYGFELMIELIHALADVRSRVEWNCGEALIVNGRIDEGLEVLSQRQPAYTLRMLVLQDRLEDAFALVGIDPSQPDLTDWFRAVASEADSGSQLADRKFELAVHLAGTLFSLGERDAAMHYLDLLAAAVSDDRNGTRLDEICQVEARLGLWPRAARRAAVILAKGRFPDPFPHLFPGRTETASQWWKLLQSSQSGSGAQALLRIGQLLRIPGAGQIPAETFERLVAQFEQSVSDSTDSAQGTGARWLALAETCLLQGREDQAEDYLRRAAPDSPAAAVRLGDRAAAQLDWATAADWYRLAYEIDSDDVVARHLHGRALIRLGRESAGQEVIHLARLLPLADTAARNRLATELNRRGFRDEAIEQWELILRTGEFLVSLTGGLSDTSMVEAAQQLGNLLPHDPRARADYWETMHLSCLEVQLWIPSFRGYFRTPHLVHRTRAEALLAEGDWQAALDEIRESERYWPASTELAEQIVPQLEALGQRAAADALFDRCFRSVAQVCRMFPNSALHHNNLAWMSARCDRRLDEALVHVQRALELVPDSVAYLDTLGEVHFRRGDVDAAIRCAERCLELDPENAFYKQQLNRFLRGQTRE